MLVSILITTYDHGRFLGDAIESAAAQEYEPLELVIIDDGSRDDSQRVIALAQALHRTRFRRFASIRLPENRGRLHALNRGLPLLHGAVTVCLDADDRLAPTHVPETVELLRSAHERDTRVAFVYTDCWLVDENGAVLSKGRSAPYDDALLQSSSYIPGCATTLTSAWRALLPFDEAVMVGEKHYRWQRMSAAGRRGVHLARPLFHYRMHDANMSGIGRKVLRARSAGRDGVALLSGYWPATPARWTALQ